MGLIINVVCRLFFLGYPRPPPSKYTAVKPRKLGSTLTTARSTRLAKKHVPRLSPSPPASADAGFVEIGHVQLWQSKMQDHDCYTESTQQAEGTAVASTIGSTGERLQHTPLRDNSDSSIEEYNTAGCGGSVDDLWWK